MMGMPGIYVVIFGACMHISVVRKLNSAVNRRLLLVTTALFVLTTVQAMLTFAQVYLTADLTSSFPFPGESKSLLRELNLDNLLMCIGETFVVVTK